MVGVLANLLLVPVGSLCCCWRRHTRRWPACCPWTTFLTELPLQHRSRAAFLSGCVEFDRLDPHFALPLLSLPQGIALSGAACVVLLAPRARVRWTACAGALLLTLLCEWQLRRSEQPQAAALRVTFVDVGQGDAALIDLPDGRAMLIDAGGNPQGGADPGERALLPLLRARRRTRLDVVVLTHPHPDHYGGLAALIDALPIGELWDSGQSASEADLTGTTGRALELVERARARGAHVLHPADLCGRTRAFAAARVDVLWPCPAFDPGFDPNDNSLVLRLTYGEHAILFTGDIEAHAEAALIARGARLRADVLKVAHHGSRTSSSDAFLRAVSPTLAVISAGAVNPFGHPHSEVLERLRKHNARVIDIGERGGRILTLDAAGAHMLDGGAQLGTRACAARNAPARAVEHRPQW